MPVLAPTTLHPDPTPDGTPSARVVHLRPLRDGEQAPILEVFDRLSARSRFLRFHTGIPHLPPRLLRHLSTLTRGAHEASVAEVDGRTVAVARWIRLTGRPTTAELAVAVADEYQGRGLARVLVAAVARSAQAAGVRSFVCTVHPENSAALAGLRAAGAWTTPGPDPELVLPVRSAAAAHAMVARGAVVVALPDAVRGPGSAQGGQ